MKPIWSKTHCLSLAEIRALVKKECQLEAWSIEALGEGFDNEAYRINHEWVFRFPHRAEAQPRMEAEIGVLGHLAPKLDLAIPVPSLVGKPNELYPYSFMGYRWLPGDVLSERTLPPVANDAFAEALGNHLRQLHDIPVQATHLDALPMPWHHCLEARKKKLCSYIAQHAKHYTRAGFDPLDLVEATQNCKLEEPWTAPSCYVHGDLYAKHLLVDKEGMPFGLIDWGDVHIGHPGVDLSIGFMLFDDNVLQDFLDGYGDGLTVELLDMGVFKAFYFGILALPYFDLKDEAPTLAWVKYAITRALSYLLPAYA
jgi:aminoglycoside phosphotransferase (APT) family kinase protein